MRPAYRPAVIVPSALALLAPFGVAAQTVTVPEEQLEGLQREAEEIRDMEIPEIDFSNPAGMVETIEEFAGSDMVEDMGLGWKRDVVWEMDISGSWGETVSGEGEIVHWRLNEPGAVINAQLRDEQREAPLMVGLVADEAVGTHVEGGGADVGIGTIDNHFFESDRILGHVRDSGRMRAPGFAPLEDMVDEFVQTLFRNSRIEVIEAGETDDGSEGWHIRWTATLEEEDQSGNPTGRVASVRGWLCDTASYDDDPEACEREAFEVVDVSPPPDRENVNPEIEHIEVTFTHPADIDSLEAGADLYTKHSWGSRFDLEGEWERSGEQTYRFILDEPLRDGVQYDIRLPGEDAETAEPVTARDTDETLHASMDWSFTTLLNLGDREIELVQDGYNGFRLIRFTDPVAIDAYQVLENVSLTAGKPAMSRIRLDWEPHYGIKEAYQADSFEMTIDITPEHSLIRGQKDIAPREGEDGLVTRIFRREGFGYNEIRAAHHTINAFGWTPQGVDEPDLSVTLAPEDPYPEPLPEAEYTARQDIEIWNEDPGDLNFHYAVMDLKGWSESSTTPWNRPMPFHDVRSLFDPDGSVPQGVYNKIDRVVRRVESYVPQYMPYIGARGMDTGFRGDRMDISMSLFSDPVRGLRAGVRVGDACSAVEVTSIGSSSGQCLANSIALSAYMVWLQNKHRELIDPEDFFVLFVPQGILGPGAVGTAPMFKNEGVYSGMKDFRARSVIVEIDYSNDPEESHSTDELALTVMHEFAHTLGLGHNPGYAGDVPAIEGYYHDRIEGFRMDSGGMSGRNKSSVEGNEESPDILAPLMWPSIRPSRDIMTAPEEYEQLQDAIAAGRTLSQ